MKVNDLPLTHNLTFEQEIIDVLDKYHYISPYRADSFDCYDTSIFTIKILRDNCYTPFLMERSPWPGRSEGHLWVAVPKETYNGHDDLKCWTMNNTWVIIETTGDMDNRLGIVANADIYRNGTLVYDEVEFLHNNETTLVWYVFKENPYSFVKKKAWSLIKNSLSVILWHAFHFLPNQTNDNSKQDLRRNLHFSFCGY